MADIVATIQADQDRVIRSDRRGILVVEGGPGTGKTVVALHRAAYLLYTHRKLLAGRGILVLGPSGAFLRYIDQVLPSLGESCTPRPICSTRWPRS
jgi:DNA helicase IV